MTDRQVKLELLDKIEQIAKEIAKETMFTSRSRQVVWWLGK